jgi:hypothetical protein
MIDAAGIKEIIFNRFNDCLKPISDISLDKANKVKMVDIPDRFHSYDDIIEKFYPGQRLRSPDMILFKSDSIWFVEFKNGKIDNQVKDNIKVKAIEGGVIVLYDIVKQYINSDVLLCDIINLEKSFALVYNDEKNPSCITSLEQKYKDHIRSTPVRFGLDIYKETFFKEVKTLSPENFKQWFQNQDFIPGTFNEEHKQGLKQEEVSGDT